MEIRCRCGAVSLEIENNTKGTRIKCLCNSCRGFAKVTKTDVLDEFGAVEIFQTTPSAVKILSGKELLRAYKISEKGAMRWVCGQCETHLANSMDKPGVAFMGIILPKHLQVPQAPELGKMEGYAQEKYGPLPLPKDKPRASLIKVVATVLWRAIFAKKKSQWAQDKAWITSPEVFSSERRKELYEAAKTC